MTREETIAELDLRYNNISSGAAPNLNLYEQSLLLTRAQEELVQAYYAGSTPRFTSFEMDEEARRNLDTLVRTADISLAAPSSYGRFNDYTIPKDDAGRKVLYILRENVISGDNGCMGGSVMNVNPVKHEDLNRILENPFKGPTRYKAIRYDMGGEDVNLHIISSVPLATYRMVWLQRPYPIILTPLKDEDGNCPFGEEYSSIRGESRPFSDTKVNEIPEALMRKVIGRACELAKAEYVGDLSASFAINSRDL